MNSEIRETILSIEQLRCRTEFREIDLQFKDSIIKSNESKLLKFIKPFIKTDYFKRFSNDLGFVESTIYLPYVKDEVVKNLNARITYLRKDITDLENKIKNHNELSWWKKLRRINE